MSSNGVRQLQKLSLSYCSHSGSSKSLRSIISNGQLVAFAEANPSVQVVAFTNNGHHPFIRGEYLTGFDKTIGVKNLDVETIMKNILRLSNSSGRKLLKFKKPIISSTPSIQGIWTPQLDIKNMVFEMKEM